MIKWFLAPTPTPPPTIFQLLEQPKFGQMCPVFSITETPSPSVIKCFRVFPPQLSSTLKILLNTCFFLSPMELLVKSKTPLKCFNHKKNWDKSHPNAWGDSPYVLFSMCFMEKIWLPTSCYTRRKHLSRILNYEIIENSKYNIFTR